MRKCAAIHHLGGVITSARGRLVTHITGKTGNLLSMSTTEKKVQLFSKLSEALFIDEASSLSLNLPDTNDRTLNNANSEVELPLSTEDYMSAALGFPLIPSSLQDTERCLNTSTELCDGDGDLFTLSRALQEISTCRQAGDSLCVLSDALCAVMTSDTSVINRAVSELLLAGTDVKALLSDGTLRKQRIEQKCMSQCDFSTISFLSIFATDVDFSRSLFYGAVFHDSVFVRCCFDGCVLKELRCSGNIRFEECSFRFADIVLRVLSGKKATPTRLVFDCCDFDLADFNGSDGLSERCFINCYNTHLAANFSSLFGQLRRNIGKG